MLYSHVGLLVVRLLETVAKTTVQQSARMLVADLPGDVQIGALFPVHRQIAGTEGCGPIWEQYGIQRAEIALNTIEELNKQLPFRLGISIRDSCWNERIAMEQVEFENKERYYIMCLDDSVSERWRGRPVFLLRENRLREEKVARHSAGRSRQELNHDRRPESAPGKLKCASNPLILPYFRCSESLRSAIRRPRRTSRTRINSATTSASSPPTCGKRVPSGTSSTTSTGPTSPQSTAPVRPHSFFRFFFT
ncbi:hypothetical protein L596_008001 [Steinernema carpocapsae]|uniref:Receptor ligand binding region domain-containing protein n=1 Tax=Steinernema carpocapsae TaxID=34508 RepID=A0A4U5PBD5_STECR|nr:hypothetical protein L596_008001 [Steinernema carpocapsae]